MTTNIERATEIVRDGLAQAWNAGPIFDTRKFPDAAAQALADAGLLMPDLPKPQDIGSGIAHLPRGVEVWDRRTVHVYLADDYGQGEARLTPQEARAYGEELIAAANHAEQEQDNV